MNHLGRNLRVNVLPALRDATRRFYEQGLGCARRSPREGVDLFDLDDGFMIGVLYDNSALSAEQMRAGVWLELTVDDPGTTAAALVALGAIAVDDAHTAHPYVAAPGGLVFRLAPHA